MIWTYALCMLAFAIIVLSIARLWWQREKTVELNRLLAESDERYHDLFDSLPIGVLVQRQDASVVASNLAARTILGVPQSRLNAYGMVDPLWRVIGEDEQPFPDEAHPVTACLNTGLPLRDIVMGLVQEERTLWLSVNAQPLFNPCETDPYAVITSFSDISPRRQATRTLEESRAKYQRLLDDIGDRFIAYSHDGLSGILSYVSDGAYATFGIHRDEAIGKSWAELVDWLPDDRESAQAVLSRYIQDKTCTHSEFDLRVVNPSGGIKTLHVIQRPIWDDAGHLVAIDGLAEDITERKAAEQRLQLAASVFTHAREGIMITDSEPKILEVNDAFSQITGYSREDVLGKNPNILSSGRHDPAFYADLWCRLHRDGYWSGEIFNRRKDGSLYTEQMTISAVRDSNDGIHRYVGFLADISRQKAQQQELEHIAHHDVLTGLPNRVLLSDRLRQAMASARRSGQTLAVAYLDLDGFKEVNDNHGHAFGDELLVSLAMRMKTALREGDTIARLGGDEFVAVIIDLPNIEVCQALLTRLLTVISEPIHVKGRMLQVSGSAGVTLFPQTEVVDADQLLRQADHAMYQAKLAGKDRYRLFDSEQDQKVSVRQQEIDSPTN